jgi:dTDP-4-amino-4,6-dideoxygalactose transaminase
MVHFGDLWSRRHLTNNGIHARRLEELLCQHLGVGHLSLVANGTLGLLIALKGLGLTGEVITTPFTFVATSHAILWAGLTPVFVDIDPETLNIDPGRIEEAVTPATSAILPVHVFGRPCEIEAIRRIADAHGLRVIYDAAHAFGVAHEGASVLMHGDASVVSFHATKVFHTLEGGAVISSSRKHKERIDQMRNFGIADDDSVACEGINAKLNEMSALVGLLNLRHIDALQASRSLIAKTYRQEMEGITGLRCMPSFEGDNHSYFPILVEKEYPLSSGELQEELKRRKIGSRRYFHPLVSSLPMYRHLPSADPANLPVANAVAEQILCLPIHAELSRAQVLRISDLLRAIASLGGRLAV